MARPPRGVTLREALSLLPPTFPPSAHGNSQFDVGESAVATLRKMADDDAGPDLRLAPGAPPGLATICHRCSMKEPAARSRSASAVAEEQQRFRCGEPIEARPIGAGGTLLALMRIRGVVKQSPNFDLLRPPLEPEGRLQGVRLSEPQPFDDEAHGVDGGHGRWCRPTAPANPDGPGPVRGGGGFRPVVRPSVRRQNRLPQESRFDALQTRPRIAGDPRRAGP